MALCSKLMRKFIHTIFCVEVACSVSLGETIGSFPYTRKAKLFYSFFVTFFIRAVTTRNEKKVQRKKKFSLSINEITNL